MSIKVSIILPSLNVVKYIKECIESVINQSLKEIEIICVDGGSTDGTLEVLKEYESCDSRVKLIVSDVKSYGKQMNLGVRAASGEYIGIVETDDYVPIEMYEELYEVAKKNCVDFVKADFYRFTGERESVSKALFQLTHDESYYNRVINIEHELECFQFQMNTWSGIYSRKFLMDNNIWHNETPGASYQDNGFWFQTLLYAKRAYFVSKPYYMNRRDNPNSSVFNKNKVFCICDEYDYLWSILKQDENRFDNYKFVLSLFCYYAYKSSLNRIALEHKLIFLERFSRDFSRIRDEGALDIRLLSDVDREMLLSIIDDYESYYESYICSKENVVNAARSYDNVIIYGAGMIGKRTLHELCYNDKPANVICFAVTDKKDNVDFYQDTPIKLISELLEYRNNSLVLVATTKVYQDEIVETLNKLQFGHVMCIPEEGINWNEKNIKKEDKLKIWYKRFTGETLDFDNLINFNQKQQWLKIYDNTELKRKLLDKQNMRFWIEEKLGKNFLVPSLGVYYRTFDIPFNELPNMFILKCTHGCRWNLYIKDKTVYESNNYVTIVRRLNAWLALSYEDSYDLGIGYEDSKPGIIIEKPVEEQLHHDAYKILCFAGKPSYIVYDSNKEAWGARKRDIYDTLWNHLPVTIKYPNSKQQFEKPKYLNEMLEISQKLSEGFDFVVVHLFETNEGILVNEIKFSLGNGVERIEPQEFSVELGNLIKCD